MCVIFFMQDTTYWCRISALSSVVCSSDLRCAPLLEHFGAVFGAFELFVLPAGGPLRRSRQQCVDQPPVFPGSMPHQAIDSLPYRLALFAWVGQQRHVLGQEQVARLPWAVGAILGFGQCARRLGAYPAVIDRIGKNRSEEHTSELQSLMRTSYAVF